MMGRISLFLYGGRSVYNCFLLAERQVFLWIVCDVVDHEVCIWHGCSDEGNTKSARNAESDARPNVLCSIWSRRFVPLFSVLPIMMGKGDVLKRILIEAGFFWCFSPDRKILRKTRPCHNVVIYMYNPLLFLGFDPLWRNPAEWVLDRFRSLRKKEAGENAKSLIGQIKWSETWWN